MHLQNKLVKKTDAIIETTKIGWFFIKLINLVYRKELFILSKIKYKINFIGAFFLFCYL